MEKKIFLVVSNDKHVVLSTFSKKYAALVADKLSLRLFAEFGIRYFYHVVSVPFVYPNVSEL